MKIRQTKYLFFPIFISFGGHLFAASHQELQMPPISGSQLNPALIMEKAKATSFERVQRKTRSLGADVYSKVATATVKVLTNEGSGSGVVIDADERLVLTNNHVTTGYSVVGIQFSMDSTDTEVVLADVIQIDEISDLALVRLKSKNKKIEPLKFATESVRIGEDVHAVGHPLDEDWTYTRGYVSQIRENYSWQTGPLEHHVADVIQTQTPINPGNSGGPLVNNEAQLVGINSFRSDGEGINFAVSLSTVKKFLENTQNIERSVAVNTDFDTLVHTEDENNNGNPDIYAFDENKNEVVDRVAFDRDEDRYIELQWLDRNENGIPDIEVYEKQIEGRMVTIFAFDENEDGEPEAFGLDEDQDGQPDKVVRR